MNLYTFMDRLIIVIKILTNQLGRKWKGRYKYQIITEYLYFTVDASQVSLMNFMIVLTQICINKCHKNSLLFYYIIVHKLLT